MNCGVDNHGNHKNIGNLGLHIKHILLRGAFKFSGLLKKLLLRPCNRGASVVKNVYVYRVITLRNYCIFSFLW